MSFVRQDLPAILSSAYLRRYAVVDVVVAGMLHG